MSARAETAQRLREKLQRELGDQILARLAEPNVIEIMLNSDGALWVEHLGEQPQRFGEMPPHQAEALMMTLASLKGHILDHRNPVIECQLPLDGSRFSGTIEPVHAPSFNIRRRALKIFSLTDYVAAGAMSAREAKILAQSRSEEHTSELQSQSNLV